MPATWPPFLDCIGAPLVIEPSVDQRSGDASALADRSPHDHDLTRHPTLSPFHNASCECRANRDYEERV
jgi:hypothetical protein